MSIQNLHNLAVTPSGMAHRFVQYEALASLNRGNYLVRFGDISFLYYLEGCRDVCHVADQLIENEWVRPVNENKTHFMITDKGRAVFLDGRERYQTFPVWKKLLGHTRLFSFTW